VSFKKYSFVVNSFNQAVQTIVSCHNKKIFPIIFIRYFMINGFGSDWLKEFNILLEQRFSKKTFKMYVDCKNNYGLFINLVEQKIDYLKIDAKKETLKRLNQIAKKNKVSLNPQFSVLDLSKIKNVDTKINRIAIK
jgi:hypothetical protein